MRWVSSGLHPPEVNGPRSQLTAQYEPREGIYFVVAMARSLSQFWFLVASFYFHAAAMAAANTPLNLTFMLVTSYGRYGFNSSGTLPAADIALERINNRSDLLPGYNLMYDTVRNSEVWYQIYVCNLVVITVKYWSLAMAKSSWRDWLIMIQLLTYISHSYLQTRRQYT